MTTERLGEPSAPPPAVRGSGDAWALAPDGASYAVLAGRRLQVCSGPGYSLLAELELPRLASFKRAAASLHYSSDGAALLVLRQCRPDRSRPPQAPRVERVSITSGGDLELAAGWDLAVGLVERAVPRPDLSGLLLAARPLVEVEPDEDDPERPFELYDDADAGALRACLVELAGSPSPTWLDGPGTALGFTPAGDLITAADAGPPEAPTAAASSCGRYLARWAARADDGLAQVVVRPRDDPDGAPTWAVRAPPFTRARLSTGGMRLVGRGAATVVVEPDAPEGWQILPGSGCQRVADEGDHGLVLVGWDRPQPVDPSSPRATVSPRHLTTAVGDGRLAVRGTRIAYGSPREGVQRCWDLTDGRWLGAALSYDPLPGCEALVRIHEAAGTWLVVADPVTGAPRARHRLALPGSDRPADPHFRWRASACDPAGEVALLTRGVGQLAAVELATGKVLWHEAEPGLYLGPEAFSPSGAAVLGFSLRRNRHFDLRSLDPRTGHETRRVELPETDSTVPTLAVRPGHEQVWVRWGAVEEDLERALCVQADGAVTRHQLDRATDRMAFDPTGALRVRSTEQGRLRIEDAETGRLLDEPPVDEPGAMAFTPEGRGLWVHARSNLVRIDLTPYLPA